ncbi:MAG: hypothetical protein JW983_05360 [Elusimicrobia bacterium]|nr:hypothetical protein [Elusimicrobiota bacterium]
MKKLCSIFLLSVICHLSSVICIHSAIRIGTEVETGGVSYSNPDLVEKSSATTKNKYMYEKTRFYLEGDLKKNVSVGFKLLSRGIFGKTAGEEYTTVKSSITFVNYTPQIENAFIRFNEVADQPVDLIFGRQPIKIGQGVIVDDDGLGFDAIRLKGYLPLDLDITVDAFIIKRTELSVTRYTDDDDEQMYAVGGNWTHDKDYNFRVYYFVEGSSSPLNKSFLSLRADGRFKEGVDYRAEIIEAGGDYSGISYLIGMTAYTKIKRLGNTSVNFEYAVGNGDENGLGFAPTYGHQTDGFERAGYGEYFGASLTDFYGGLKTFKTDGQGVHTTTLGIGFEPYKNLNFNFDYYILFSLDYPELTDDQSHLGEEIDLTLRYKYTENCFIKFIYGRLSPLTILKTPGVTEKVFANKLGWSVTAKF